MNPDYPYRSRYYILRTSLILNALTTITVTTEGNCGLRELHKQHAERVYEIQIDQTGIGGFNVSVESRD